MQHTGIHQVNMDSVGYSYSWITVQPSQATSESKQQVNDSYQQDATDVEWRLHIS